MKFYEIFIKLCDEHKIAATNVVKTLKISTSKPTNWKNGATPSVEHLLEIANYFNVSIDYLLGLTNISTPNYDEERLLAYGGGDVTPKKKINVTIKSKGKTSEYNLSETNVEILKTLADKMKTTDKGE